MTDEEGDRKFKGGWHVNRLAVMVLLGVVTLMTSTATAADDAEMSKPPIEFKGIFSSRTRFEFNDFFRSSAAGVDNKYGFFANTTRFGARIDAKGIEAVAVGQYAKLWDLPQDALGMPGGPHGVGGVYFAHNRSEGPDSLGVKYAWIKLKDLMGEPLSLQVGRFGYTSAVERPSGNPKLDKLKNIRLAERLIGEFGYTHFTRSFDGFRLDWDNDYGRVTAYGFRPTQGGFERDINERINDIDVVGGAITSRSDFLASPAEFQLFYNFYDDERSVTARVDNEGGVVARQDIQIHTIGGHAVGLIGTDVGQVDWLLWGAVQTGDWFDRNHLAGTFAAEVGLQIPDLPGKPWFRAGYNFGSGDDDSSDGDHNTFYQILPTARKYSLSVNYNLMNSHDLFAQVIIPGLYKGLLMRFDVHHIRLAESNDLYYVGAGPTQESGGIAGFVGRPNISGDRSALTVVEGFVNYKFNDYLSAGAYYGHSFGHDVVEGIFTERDDADYFFADITIRLP